MKNRRLWVVWAVAAGLVLVGLALPRPTKAQGVLHITCHGWVGKYAQILALNPDGSGLVQLTNAKASSLTPAWSPRQEYIAFARDFDRSNVNNPIYVMEAVGEAYGGRIFPVTDGSPSGGDSDPDWSPYGTQIVETVTSGS